MHSLLFSKNNITYLLQYAMDARLMQGPRQGIMQGKRAERHGGFDGGFEDD